MKSNKPVIVQILRAPIGGIRKHVFDIIESLEESDCEQILITNVDHADRPVPFTKNLTVYHLPIIDKPGPMDFIQYIKILFFLKKYKSIKVIHGHGAKGGIYARGLALFFKAKIIYTPHGGSLHRVYGALKNKIYDLIEVLLVPLTNVFLFESFYSADTFSKNIKDVSQKSIINYNGVEIPSAKSTNIYQSQAPLKIASFGLLRNLKGHDIAIETCKLLKKAEVPFFYTIYGAGESKHELLNLIQRYELGSNIVIKEYCEDVLNEMMKFDFIFHPSRFESFGYVPAEAMSLNIPVVLSNEGGLKEVIDTQTGFISRNNSPEEYAEIFKSIYKDASQLPVIIDAARTKVIKLFSKEMMLKKIKEIYGSRK